MSRTVTGEGRSRAPQEWLTAEERKYMRSTSPIPYPSELDQAGRRKGEVDKTLHTAQSQQHRKRRTHPIPSDKPETVRAEDIPVAEEIPKGEWKIQHGQLQVGGGGVTDKKGTEREKIEERSQTIPTNPNESL